MKIALVYDPVYPYVIGGAEKRYRDFAVALAKKGHDVYLVGMKYWQGEDLKMEDGIKLAGICKAVPLYNKSGARSVFEAVYFGWHVFVHLLRNSYDVVDCCSFPYFSAIACRLAVLFRGRGACGKLVITWLEIWGKAYWRKYSGALWFVGHLLEKIASKLTVNNIAISRFTAFRMAAELGVPENSITVVPCGIDCDFLRAKSSADKENQLVYVGRVIEHKRVDMLIEAFGELVAQKSFPADIKLRIVGSGPAEENCRKLTRRLGLGESVEFAGFLKENDLFEEIAASLVFILPSEREGLGISVVESMALGTPVIARNAEYSAVKEIINSGVNGILFNDKNGLKDALVKLLTDKALYARLTDEGYKTASAYDLISKTAPKLEEYYRNAKAVR